jgi:hypothetical protein
MSQLDPGAMYVYEREGTRIYARKMGSTERTLIGEDFLEDIQARRQKLAQEWEPIVYAAEQNPALQEAIDRVKILYALIKEENTIEHHPV